MKNFSKIIGISILCGMFFLGFSTKAFTGDTTGTGNVSTGSELTGTASTGTIAYTGLLLNYLNTQESSLTSGFSTTYAKLYGIFSKTGLNILKSIEYQSLVCLGAIKNESALSQLQKDKTTLTIAFKKDFIELENQILALEEKQALQISDNVNVFDAGTTYESEKAKLKELIDAKVKLHKEVIANFETSYIAKNIDFLTTFQQYSSGNKDLIKGIQDKMDKVQVVLTAFSGVEAIVNSINAKITGLSGLMQKMTDSKNKGLSALNTSLQPLIDSNIKKYPRLKNLADELEQQKAYLLGQYELDLDEYLNNNLETRYNRSQFMTLQKEVNAFKSKYYTSTNQLNCSNIIATVDASTALLTKINSMKVVVNSGLAKIESGGISTTFKDQLYSGFQSLYVQKFKQRYTEYLAYMKSYIVNALTNFVTGLIPATTTPVTNTTEKVTKAIFTKPFNLGQYHQDIKTLQNLLTTLSLYSGAIDGVYNKATKDGVYKFQLSKGLLKGYEKKPATWGWMGPATRAALNKLTQ